MYERLKRWLRGDYNSIRYRYFVLPREWLAYLVGYRLLGKKWIDFYAHRLDGFSAKRAEPKKSYLDFGEFQLNYLKSVGLKPEHKFLDYGCGIMRTGIHLASYLRPGNYLGVDISKERLAQAHDLMQSRGFGNNDYEAILVEDCRLEELEGRKFDYIFAGSVLTHMPTVDIQIAMATIHGLLAPGGQFFFTFAEADVARRRNIKDFWYPREQIAKLCRDGGLKFEVMDDYPGQGDVMGRAWVDAQTEKAPRRSHPQVSG